MGNLISLGIVAIIVLIITSILYIVFYVLTLKLVKKDREEFKEFEVKINKDFLDSTNYTKKVIEDIGGKFIMNIDYIDLVLENCDVIRLESKDIDFFYIEGITETYTSQRDSEGNLYTDKTEHCSHLGLLINNPKELTFDSLDGEITVYERVENYHDITAIDIIYEDKTHEYIYVDWNDYNYNYNLNQKTDYYYNILEVTINEDNSKGFLKDTSDEMDVF